MIISLTVTDGAGAPTAAPVLFLGGKMTSAVTRTAMVVASAVGLALIPAVAIAAPASAASGQARVMAAATASDTTPPPAPTGLHTSVSSRAVTVSWSAVTASDLAGYLVYRSTTSPVTLDAAHRVSVATPFNALQFTDFPPATGETYHYVVVAVDTSANQSASDPVSAVSNDFTPPPAPTGVVGTVDSVAGTYTISWDPKAADDTQTVGYRRGSCSPEVSDPCFVDVSSPLITGTSVTSAWTSTGPSYQLVCAEDAHFQRACTRVTIEPPAPVS